MRIGHLSVLLVVPLLAVTAGCGEVMGLIEQNPPPAAVDEPAGVPNGEEEEENGEEAQNPDLTDDIHFTGISARTNSDHVWAEPLVDDTTVTILRSVTQMSDHVYFEVPYNEDSARFIGHFVGNAFLVRAAVCPNCAKEAVEWHSDQLVCESCSLSFDPVNGVAKEEEGRSYPEGWIMNSVFAERIVMVLDDLQVAYQRTASGEERLFEGRRDLPSPSRCVGCG